MTTKGYKPAQELSAALYVPANAVTVEKNYPTKMPYLKVSFSRSQATPPGLEQMARKFVNDVLTQDYFSQPFIDQMKTTTPDIMDQNGILTDKGLVVAFEPLPGDDLAEKLKELLIQVQESAEANPKLLGVYVSGGKFVALANMPGEELQLAGKLRDPAQSQELISLVNEAMGSDPYWREGEGPLVVSTANMRIAPGSLQLANQFYALGLEYFWRGQYPEADKAFSQAVSESPQDDVFRYWRVVCALAQNQEDRAKQKLAPLMETNTLGSRTPVIATAFERLQGPLRQRLVVMENEIQGSF
jgi:tetratricopeptide (TPR) repeat protein